VVLLALAFVSGCHHSPPPPPLIVDLVVDSNRNGAVEPGLPDEEDAKDTWDAKHGAVLLANVDDDDLDGKADADDDVVNGARDLDDLAPIVVAPSPGAPADASALLSVDAAAAPLVRVFRVTGAADDPASYHAQTDPTHIALAGAELAAGARFAIEARDFVSSTAPGAWSGFVELTLSATDPRTRETAIDHARMRVAPLLFQWNTARPEAIFYSDGGADTRTLADGIAPACTANQVAATGLDIMSLPGGFDQWTQDFFDIGYTSRPGPGGAPVGMKVAVRCAEPDRGSGEITTRYFRGVDFGSVYKFSPGVDPSSNGYSLSSFGNWDVIPPYSKGTEEFPLGRNVWGATATVAPDPVFSDFVRAQKVQPEINLDTSWLVVGHVDEFTSFGRSTSPRGWALLVASPRIARQMLTDLSTAGHGEAQLFVGKSDYDLNGNATPAAIAVNAVLADADLMAASQAAQVSIDAQRAKLVDEIGLDAGEVIDIPFLFERSFGALVAYQPGTVNMLHVGSHVVAPDPFGPIIDGQDPWKSDLVSRLSAIGLTVHFADDWDEYHTQEGEVHCGTNAQRDIGLAWWEGGR
jgi:protein-arginine deiminase